MTATPGGVQRIIRMSPMAGTVSLVLLLVHGPRAETV